MSNDQSVPKPLRKGFKALTTRFIVFYFLLVFLPTVAFVGIYSSSLMREQQNEQRYKEQLLLKQNAQFLEQYLMKGETIGSSLQADTMLVNLLENNYLSASDELYAYVSHIQPMFSAILITNPTVRDIYIYRYVPSHITNSDLVYNLCTMNDYAYDRAYVDSRESVHSFLALTPDMAHHQEDDVPTGPQFVYLTSLYNRTYSQVMGILEVQVDLEKALTALDIPPNQGLMYLKYRGDYYPIRFENGAARLKSQEPLVELNAPHGAQVVSEAILRAGLELTYIIPEQWESVAAVTRNVILSALVLLLPTLAIYIFIYRYALRLSRFSRHIRKSQNAALIKYTGDRHQDELSDLILEYNGMVDTIHTLIDEVRQAEKLKNAATYYAMISQVNPHFMFNTLENIRMQIELEHYTDAGQMLFVLGRFLRYNISMRRESKIMSELEHIQHYLKIYQYRIGDMVKYSLDIPPDMENVRCPFCMLQPIVENCLKHGIREVSTPITVSISIKPKDGDLLITVSDNGTGMAEEDIKTLNEVMKTPEIRDQNGENHVGLQNVNARVKYFYGLKYGLTIEANTPAGLKCHILIGREPLQDIL